MNSKQCKDCFSIFHFNAGEEWKTVCVPCYIKNKNAERKKKAGKDYQDWAESLSSKRTEPVGVIPVEMLSRLIRLCHPDKHNNSEASNSATSWLLLQRGAKK